MRWLILVVFMLSTVSSALSQVNAGPDQSICIGQSTILQGTGPASGYDYTWTSIPNDPTISNPNILSPTIQPTLTTAYTLEGKTVSNINLVNNGDFQAGNTGFTSDYDYCDQPDCLNVSPPGGIYGINSNPSYLHNAFPSCGDHTTGSGNMLVANGDEFNNQTLYQYTVTNISQNTDYEFSTWITSMVWSIPMFGANFSFEINGTTIGTYSATSSICTWGEFFYVWNSGTSNSATIRIINTTTVASGMGNDFAIDDVALYEVIKEYDDCTVTVMDIPTSTFNLPAQICESDTALITYTGNAPPSPTADYNWDFGSDATVISGVGEGPYQVTWSTAGTKTVSLWVETGCVSNTTSQHIVINGNPVVDVTADATTIPYGTNTILHGIMSGIPGSLQFYWEPIAKLVNPTNQNPQTVPLEQATKYYFFVEDQGSGCASMDSIIIDVTGGALTITSITGTPNTVCSGEITTLQVIVSGGNVGNYAASWTTNPLGYTNTGLSVDANPSITTTYIVVVDDGYNSITDSIEIAVLPSTTIISQPQDAELIEGASASFSVLANYAIGFQWQESNDNGSTWNNLTISAIYSGVNSPTLVINPVDINMDNNLYRCLITGQCNNITSTEASLTVYELPNFICNLDQAEICVGDTFSIACDVTNFLQIINFNLSVDYNSNQLRYRGIANIRPEITDNLMEAISGSNVTLSWSSIQEFSLPDGVLFDFTFIALSDGTTSISWNHQMSNVTNQPGFHPTMELDDGDVLILPLASAPDYASTDKDTINIVNESNIILTAIGGSGDELIWSTDNCNGDITGYYTPLEIPRPEQTTTYYAYWENQCGNSSCAEVEVVIIYDYIVDIPNAFSPNDDGLNDEFKVITNAILDGFQMQIFNRWGQLIFETTDQYKGWNGYYKNNMAEVGSYVWRINYNYNLDGSKKNSIKTGTVTLIN